MHVGHAYASTGSDIVGRFKRMQGYDVLQPMGFDAFGIHGENYAIKVGEHPSTLMEDLCDRFRDEQFDAIGHGYDWSKEVRTYWPEYYKWTQWIFVQLFKHGLAERKKANVNWCPGCKTVLADEQVISGECERCHSQVEHKELEQWFFKITKFADKLLENLDTIDWSKKVVEAQRNWIGKSEGAEISFKIDKSDQEIKVFTTRPDTIFGATYMVLSPEHPLVKEITTEDQKSVVNEYVSASIKKTENEKSKTGVFTGSYAINPASGEKMPIWIADYVLMEYGFGAIMAVPAHDERDFEFARKYKIKIRKVINPINEFQSLVLKESLSDEEGFVKKCLEVGLYVNDYEDWGYKITGGDYNIKDYKNIVQKSLIDGPWYVDIDGMKQLVIFKDNIFDISKKQDEAKKHAAELGIPSEQIDWQSADDYQYCFPVRGTLVNSGEYSGLSSDSAVELLTSKFGSIIPKTTYKLRDWLISRQRYWSAPIPMIYCEKCGWIAVPEDQLPVELPYVEDWKPKGDGRGPLANIPEFVNTKCPKCNGLAHRETDTLDNFLDSGWYFFRYPFVDRRDVPFAGSGVEHADDKTPNSQAFKNWFPLSLYIGGPEHSVLHLMYTRFLTMAFKEMGFIDFDEPFVKFFAHGHITKDGKKMSKSLGNIVNPDEYIESIGADAFRMYLMFLGPFDQGGDFSENGITGVVRFLNKVWSYINDDKKSRSEKSTKNSQQALNIAIKGVTEDIEAFKFNTSIAKLMEFMNVWAIENEALCAKDSLAFVKLLAPFAPFITEEIYQNLYAQQEDNKMVNKNSSNVSDKFNSIHVQFWPGYNENLVKVNTITIAIQVNGKLRGTLNNVSIDIKKDEVIKKSKEIVAKYIEDKEIKKEIYVPEKLINFVVG